MIASASARIFLRRLLLEFGVYRGTSMKWWLARIPNKESRFVGFDTFTGLPEHWRATEPLGAFNANGKIPDITDPRCSFEIGLFQETLGNFVKRNDLSGRLVINLDADLYSSTLFVLTTLAPYLKPRDIISSTSFPVHWTNTELSRNTPAPFALNMKCWVRCTVTLGFP